MPILLRLVISIALKRVSLIVSLIAPILLVVLIYRVLGQDDANYLLVWWLVIFVLGNIFLPFTALIFGRFSGKGYFFSKIIGLAIAGYITWTLSMLRVLPFTAWAAYLVLAVCLAGNLVISSKTGIWPQVVKDRGFLGHILRQEILFMLALLFWTYLRALRPAIIGEEMYMDFGFLNSILRAEYFPPLDMWYAPEHINYYYLGQYFSAYLTRLSFVRSEVSYNLLMASLFAITFMGSYTIVSYLIEIFNWNANDDNKVMRFAKPFCGILSGALTTLSGNMHTPVYMWFRNWFTAENRPSWVSPYSWVGNLFYGEERPYWFPEATRYIGHNPPVANDHTIHEFPLYSYIVSDLHAHVINVIFVLVAVAICIAICMDILSLGPKDKTDKMSLSDFFPGMKYLLLIFIIGLFPSVNFWDFPIYLVVAFFIFLYANLKRFQSSWWSVLVSVSQLGFLTLSSFAVMVLFFINFEAMATSIELVTTRSLFYQLVVLYGYQAVFFIMLIFATVIYYRRGTRIQGEKSKEGHSRLLDFIDRIDREDVVALILFSCAIVGMVVTPTLVELDGEMVINVGLALFLMVLVVSIFIFFTGANNKNILRLLDYVSKLNPADAIVLILFSCAIGLIAIPEFIFVRDIYPTAPRANTMFKLTYQAFIMLTMGIAYTFTRLFLTRRILTLDRMFVRVAGLTFSIALISFAFVYPFVAISAWYGPFFGEHTREYEGLDGIRYMRTHVEFFPDEGHVWGILEEDYYIVRFMNENIQGQPIIMEVNGDAYTSFGRISVKTGLPTVFNWFSHQWLWRASDGEHADFHERIRDIEILYTTHHVDDAWYVINKYNIEYIVVGRHEHRRFQDSLNMDLLLTLGEPIFSYGESVLIKVSN